MYLTLYCLAGLALWLAAGMLLAQTQPYMLHMKAMDQTLLRDWLAGPALGQPVVLVWFLVLCGGVGLLALNMAVCTWTKLLPRLKGNGGRLRTWFLAGVHVLMLLVLLGHLSQMGLGFKLESVKLLPGQSRELPDGSLLTVTETHFADDPALLNLSYRQGRASLLAGVFHREKNTASLELSLGGRSQAKGVLRILEPWEADGLRVTLAEFFRDDSQTPPRVGVLLTVARNPLEKLFFASYLAWILVYIYLAATVRKHRLNHLNGDANHES
ncbi:hypothetical protein AAU61_08145 [Desulfocarbo indianensis]|nr:hypothetical protein AAU61_08145 [Desulfocarbo indianensis]